MVTTIKSGLRVFLVTGDYNQTFFCQLEELEKCVTEIKDADSLKIKHFFNGKFSRINKRQLKAMLSANDLNNKFL